ncbi:MAG: zinc-ribbon domain-containing protein [Rhodocyclaceae bacterium]|nr:zinc-ribbon domain-containing protein [Rhodocyclaceae bacterium]
MLLICPSCNARYLVADTVIGPAGRRVRCATCKHVWFQDAPQEEAQRDLVAVGAATQGQRVAEQPVARQASAPPVAMPPPPSQPDLPAYFDRPFQQEHTPASASPEMTETRSTANSEAVRPNTVSRHRQAVGDSRRDSTRANGMRFRRKPSYLWVAGAVIILVGANIYLWSGNIRALWHANVSNTGSAKKKSSIVSDPTTVLQSLHVTYGPPIPFTSNDRRMLQVNGTINNSAKEIMTLPRLRGHLLDATGKDVYVWEFTVPQTTINPGAAVQFSTNATNIPETAQALRLEFVGS